MSEDSITAVTYPGQVLANAREVNELTLEDIASRLNLPVRTVRAVETNNQDALPEAVYVFGYIRAYAKILGLEPQPLVDSYAILTEGERGTEPSLASPSPQPVQSAFALSLLQWGWLLLGVVVFLGLVYATSTSELFGDANETAEPSRAERSMAATEKVSSSTQATDEVEAGPSASESATAASNDSLEVERADSAEASGAEIAASEAGMLSQSETPSAVTEPVDLTLTIATEGTPAPGEQSGLPVTLALAAAETTAETSDFLGADRDQSARSGSAAESTQAEFALISYEPGLPRRLTEFGEEQLKLSFSEDCWFEIMDEDGTILFADLGRGGQAREFVGMGPFRIKLGFAAGAAVAFNGDPIDLAPYTRRNMARVTLGD